MNEIRLLTFFYITFIRSNKNITGLRVRESL